MYHQFTVHARNVFQLANREAQRFNHEYIGTEHILLGLLADGSGVAGNILKSLPGGLAGIRKYVEKILLSASEPFTAGNLPLTPRAKSVIEYSIEESRRLKHNYVGTEHILLGLLREHEGVAAQILMNFGLLIEQVRNEIVNLLGQTVERDVCSTEPDAPSRRESESLTLPEECPTCGSQTIRVLSGWRSSLISAEDDAAIKAGGALLGPGDFWRAPARVCLACAPSWRLVHDLSRQDYECQLAKEDAIADQDFDRAAFARDRQAALHSRLAELLNRLLGPPAQ